jgi:hypothetical protein
MNDMFNKVVSFNTAKLLNNRVYGDEKYALEDLKVTWDNFLSTGNYKEGELITDGDNIHGKYVMAPTIADVIDWLFEECKIVFRFEPVYTFSTNEHIAYYFKAYKVNHDESKLDVVYQDDLYMYTIDCAVETVLKEIVFEEDGRDTEER